MAGGRRQGRILALQSLYEADTVGHDPEAALARLLEEQRPSRAVAAFAGELVRGVLEHRRQIDAILQRAAPAWPLEQVAVVDRNILRLAIFEVVINNKVPIRAAINEAVELAKTFGGESSPRFVNGVLGTVSLAASRSGGP